MSNTTTLAANIKLESGWNTFWNAVNSATGTKITSFMAVAGVCAMVFAIISYGWGKFRNRPAQPGTVMWAMIVGALLAGPAIIIPTLLKLGDLVVALIQKLLGG